MSAVPKKKLCWNCEGSVSREIDNCPYCGVYLHGAAPEEDPRWNPSYQPASQTEEIPLPLYQIHPEPDLPPAADHPGYSSPKITDWPMLLNELKREVFPLLFLMSGSVCLIFGMVLWLFAQKGTLTLQWQEAHGPYFLGLALPLLLLGWKCLHDTE